MYSWLPSFAYPPSGPGYWDPVTSTINWCEEVPCTPPGTLLISGNAALTCMQDYYATIYSAEIVNTLTNLLFIGLALKGVLNCYKHDHDRIFLITYAGYMAVGVGSFLFHATLKCIYLPPINPLRLPKRRERKKAKSKKQKHVLTHTLTSRPHPDPMQLIDELSMIYTTCFSCYASFSYRRTRAQSTILGTLLLALAIFITLYYHYLQDPTFHQNAFAILICTVVFRSVYVMEMELRPSLSRARRGMNGNDTNGGAVAGHGKGAVVDEKEQRRRDERDLGILRMMWSMISYGLSSFIGGFLIWTLDNEQCSRLRWLRRQIGLPWGIVLEGHGWW